MTRVLVIGSGSNGLVAACELAAAGLDVEVLEHAPRPGGACSSFTHEGFTHDHCAGFNPMTVVSPAFERLELGIDWVDPPTVMAHPFRDGTAIALERDVEATVASLGGSSGAAWRELWDELGPHAIRLAHVILKPLAPVREPAAIVGSLRRDAVELARRMLGSVEALGLDLFEGAERPTAWLAGSAQHSGLPPVTAGSGAFGLLLQLLGHARGWPFPRGGQQRIADTLLDRLGAAGGQVRCDAHVERILVQRGRVRGAVLRGGEQVRADAVVSTLSAKPFVELLGDGVLAGRLARRLRRWRYGTAAFKIDFELAAPVPWAAEEARRAAVVHVGGELRQLARAAEQGRRGETPDAPALVVGQQSLFDDSRAPDGHHTLYTYAHVPSELPDGADAVIERMEAQLERFAPGFRELVLHRIPRPPAQSEAENPNIVGGDLAGGTYELDQLLVFRPAPELARYRVPGVRGLYMAGASVHPGGAVHGMSGLGAARSLLSDRRLRPWRRV